MKSNVVSVRLSDIELMRYKKLAQKHNISISKAITRYANLGYAHELSEVDKPDEEVQKEFFSVMHNLFSAKR